MKYYYDLHLHSCLSPCGDKDMTPNNIVSMAKLLGLDIIALTDHNSVLNCEAVIKVAKKQGICAIAGMELTTAEEIHAVCLFPDLESAIKFNDYVSEHQLKINNRKDIYGEQLILNENDEIVGEVENLLILATDISITNAKDIVESFGGICYPAHIDRDSMSILSVLGEIPPECNFNIAELSTDGNLNSLIHLHPILGNMRTVKNSDAHYLENMRDKENYLELDSLNIEQIFCKLNTNK